MMQDSNFKDDVNELSLCISPSRMRTMMKSSPDVDCVSAESVMSMIKATVSQTLHIYLLIGIVH